MDTTGPDDLQCGEELSCGSLAERLYHFYRSLPYAPGTPERIRTRIEAAEHGGRGFRRQGEPGLGVGRPAGMVCRRRRKYAFTLARVGPEKLRVRG
jgi:hypothetical protein